MLPALPVVAAKASIDEIAKKINKQVPAVLVDLGNGKHHIVTRHDLINAYA
jgi:cystathionine beta-synthase